MKQKNTLPDLTDLGTSGPPARGDHAPPVPPHPFEQYDSQPPSLTIQAEVGAHSARICETLKEYAAVHEGGNTEQPAKNGDKEQLSEPGKPVLDLENPFDARKFWKDPEKYRGKVIALRHQGIRYVAIVSDIWTNSMILFRPRATESRITLRQCFTAQEEGERQTFQPQESVTGCTDVLLPVPGERELDVACVTHLLDHQKTRIEQLTQELTKLPPPIASALPSAQTPEQLRALLLSHRERSEQITYILSQSALINMVMGKCHKRAERALRIGRFVDATLGTATGIGGGAAGILGWSLATTSLGIHLHPLLGLCIDAVAAIMAGGFALKAYGRGKAAITSPFHRFLQEHAPKLDERFQACSHNLSNLLKGGIDRARETIDDEQALGRAFAAMRVRRGEQDAPDGEEDAWHTLEEDICDSAGRSLPSADTLFGAPSQMKLSRQRTEDGFAGSQDVAHFLSRNVDIGCRRLGRRHPFFLIRALLDFIRGSSAGLGDSLFAMTNAARHPMYVPVDILKASLGALDTSNPESANTGKKLLSILLGQRQFRPGNYHAALWRSLFLAVAMYLKTSAFVASDPDTESEERPTLWQNIKREVGECASGAMGSLRTIARGIPSLVSIIWETPRLSALQEQSRTPYPIHMRGMQRDIARLRGEETQCLGQLAELCTSTPALRDLSRATPQHIEKEIALREHDNHQGHSDAIDALQKLLRLTLTLDGIREELHGLQYFNDLRNIDGRLIHILTLRDHIEHSKGKALAQYSDALQTLIHDLNTEMEGTGGFMRRTGAEREPLKKPTILTFLPNGSAVLIGQFVREGDALREDAASPALLHTVTPHELRSLIRTGQRISLLPHDNATRCELARRILGPLEEQQCSALLRQYYDCGPKRSLDSLTHYFASEGFPPGYITGARLPGSMNTDPSYPGIFRSGILA